MRAIQVCDRSRPAFIGTSEETMSAAPKSEQREANESVAPCVLTVGNFDGVHLGHKSIIRDVVADAERLGVPPIALTFEPHPVSVFRGLDPASFRVTTSPRRETLLKRAGIESVVTAPFTVAFASLSPSEFVTDVLMGRLGVRALHVGYDFSFGKGASGGTELLSQMLGQHDVPVTVHEAVTLGGEPISSTRLRDAIRSGNLVLLRHLLGSPYSIAGQTSAGAGRGAKMSIPTLNLYPNTIICPPHGVYATRVICNGVRYDAISNLGVRPSFDDGERVSFETMVLGDFPIEGRNIEIEVELLAFVREERAFDSADDLQRQIGDDVVHAKAIHAAT
ncbi:MAG: riboflavin kinase/FMN adenylyltransferase [Bradymonadia bacterium]|jgi:riboflavin kinase/FMN adenylyltransferase